MTTNRYFITTKLLNTKGFLFLLPLIAILAVAGCSTAPKEDITKRQSAEYFYDKARAALENRQYRDAIDYYETIEARFPYAEFTKKAQIEVIYAYFKANQYTACYASADRYIRLYPQDENVDYAYYMKGQANYMAEQTFIRRLMPIDPSKRDPGKMRESFENFSELAKRFPESPYAADARKRMLYIRNLLAQHEVGVAQFYLERGAFVAAANRAKYVIKHFHKTPSVPDAMAIQVAAYEELELSELANSTLELMRTNYPQHDATERAEKALAG